MNLKIILSQEQAPILPALDALIAAAPRADLYCLCADESDAGRINGRRVLINADSPLKLAGVYTFRDYNSPASLANSLFANGASGFLLFLSSNVVLEKDALAVALERLNADTRLAGVNPLLLAGWTDEERVAFMGLTFDYQKEIHYLYEGALAAGDLAKKERSFQIAHPGALLIRGEDFARVDGARADLGPLTFPDLCLRILKFRPGGYACAPASRGSLVYKFDSWDFCGAWNSVLRRGRLRADDVRADYSDFCATDGVEYSCDDWLVEGPTEIPDLSEDPAVKRWREWRRHPRPLTLLAFLASLPADELPAAIELARERPASLPQTLRFYEVQAEKIKAAAPALGEAIEAWRKKIRRFRLGELKPGVEALKKTGIYNCALDVCPAIYDAWIEIAEKFERLEPGESWPEIGVVTPVWNPRPKFLIEAIESVREQIYPNWQLRIADDASTDREIRPILERFAREDKRIKVAFRESNGHICRASNTALEMIDAPFAAFLDHDDLLSPHALGEVARAIARKPDLGFIYTDDDRINEDNVRRSPVFKPDFDRDLFFTGHLSTYSTRLVREVGGLRVGLEGTQDQDLSFRITELLDDGRVAHIPRVLYHWRVHEDSTAGSFLAKPYVLEATRRVFLDAAARTGRVASKENRTAVKSFKLLYEPNKEWRCAVVLLINDAPPSPRLLAAIDDLAARVRVEIYAQPLRRDSPAIPGVANLPFAGDGFARACAAAASNVDGDLIIFLAAELRPGWECRLDQLAETAMAPHVAMAGGAIWVGDRLANGGWYPDLSGLPFPLLRGSDRERQNYVWGQFLLPRRVLGAPWQCMAAKAEYCRGNDFLRPEYGSLATVDYGLRAMSRDKFVVMNPWVNFRFDAPSPEPTEAEFNYLFALYGEQIASCGLRNPNLKAAPDLDWTLIL